MNIAVFGATGRTGRIVANALAEEHHVTALVRDMKKGEDLLHSDISLINGDAREEEALRRALSEADVIFSALGTDKTTTLSDYITKTLHIMEENDIPRILTIGTAGILDSRIEPGRLRYETNESKRKQTFAAEEHESVFRTLEKSDRAWTILCPTYLPEEEKQGPLREEQNHLPEDGKKAPVGDVAEVAVRELITPRYENVRVGLAL